MDPNTAEKGPEVMEVDNSVSPPQDKEMTLSEMNKVLDSVPLPEGSFQEPKKNRWINQNKRGFKKKTKANPSEKKEKQVKRDPNDKDRQDEDPPTELPDHLREKIFNSKVVTRKGRILGEILESESDKFGIIVAARGHDGKKPMFYILTRHDLAKKLPKDQRLKAGQMLTYKEFNSRKSDWRPADGKQWEMTKE